MEKAMNRYPRDMFEEMDAIFDHLFARIEEDPFGGQGMASGFRVFQDHPDPFLSLPDEAPVSCTKTSANPPTEVHRIDDEIKVVTELPGATEESIRLGLGGETLVIDAESTDTSYHTTADLPRVDAGSRRSTFRNCVLEVTFRALLEPGQPA
jgi:HSP20 family molecular chaperone IbpA